MGEARVVGGQGVGPAVGVAKGEKAAMKKYSVFVMILLAWMLWSKFTYLNENPPRIRWAHPIDKVFKTKEDCTRWMISKIDRMSRRKGAKTKKISKSKALLPGNRRIAYFCHPADTDPRPRKQN